MRVVHDLADLQPPGDGSVVTIGAYDGVHLGHQAVLRLVHELAVARRHDAVCVTFDRHPAEVVRPDSAPCLLTTLEQKLELLDATGYLDTTVVIAFDEDRSHEPAEDFVHEVLVKGLQARVVVVGADFHFGHRRYGTVHLLEQMGAELGFEVVGLGLVPVVNDPGLPYSSTAVRDLLHDGRVAEVAALLGRPPRPYEVRGSVVTGDRRGRTLGYPTANVDVEARQCLPADGIYAGTFIAEDGVEHLGAISVGRRPTFHADATRSLLEVYVLDFDGDLYGQTVKVRVHERLRGEERFDSVDELVTQIEHDVESTRRLLTDRAPWGTAWTA
ncbi:MAG TPA: bifunctional riboflavin kinase/FAD synthetase [Acidimicrobiia bacterium]|nr:bifunctional riboflavin kinase/FAD synthetase [Acidimicrobiia bacterium]